MFTTEIENICINLNFPLHFRFIHHYQQKKATVCWLKKIIFLCWKYSEWFLNISNVYNSMAIMALIDPNTVYINGSYNISDVLSTSKENYNINMSIDSLIVANSTKRDYVFDRTDVRVIFVTLYSAVFCCCFFGKCLKLHNIK